MMNMVFLTILYTWLSFIPVSLHEFHTSLAQVQYNASSQSFEVSIRVFTDDLEAALSKESGKKVVMDEGSSLDNLVEQYITKHFALLDGKKQKMPIIFIGKEADVDVTWIYLEIPVKAGEKARQIQNSVLMELFSDQINIVNYHYLKDKQTFLFKPEQTLQLINN